MHKYLPYAGIGSRNTPNHICNLFTRIAARLEELGFTLRSGGADGADTAFEAGTKVKEIFIPWNGFNQRSRGQHNVFEGWPSAEIQSAACELAQKYHPAWDRCSPGARKMHMRNASQILGWRLDIPSKFVVCWTEGGQLKGGTSQALRMAKFYQIPVFNFGICETNEDIQKMLELMSQTVNKFVNAQQKGE